MVEGSALEMRQGRNLLGGSNPPVSAIDRIGREWPYNLAKRENKSLLLIPSERRLYGPRSGPYRLTVRTSAFQAGNRGSTPLRATKIRYLSCSRKKDGKV